MITSAIMRAQNKHVYTQSHIYPISIFIRNDLNIWKLFVSFFAYQITILGYIFGWLFYCHLKCVFMVFMCACVFDDKKVCWNRKILLFECCAFLVFVNWVKRKKELLARTFCVCTTATSCIAFKYNVMCQLRLNDICLLTTHLGTRYDIIWNICYVYHRWCMK